MNWNLDAFGNIADIIAVPIAIIGVGFLARQMYLSRIEDKSEHLKRQKEATLNAYNLVRDDLSERTGKIRKKLNLKDMYTKFTHNEVKKIHEDEKLRIEMPIVLGIFERFSIGVQHGVYNRDLISDLSGNVFINTYRQFEPYIQDVRREFGYNVYNGFEQLTKELEYIREVKNRKNMLIE